MCSGHGNEHGSPDCFQFLQSLGRDPPSRFQTLELAQGSPTSTTSIQSVESEAGQVTVGHDLEDDVLIAIAKGGSERVGRVGGRGPIEDHGSLTGLHLVGDILPFGEGCYGDGRGRDELLGPWTGVFLIKWQLELATVIPGRVCFFSMVILIMEKW